MEGKRMKHFDYVEWLFYKENLISLDRQKKMEEHLYNCDKCLETFLSIIDENEIESASKSIPEDFTENLIDEISKKKVKTLEKEKTKARYINFGYYVAIASVTIILTTAGFFNNMIESVPKISGGIRANSNIERPNLVYEYSEKIMGMTSKFINDIENIEEREIRRKQNERQK